MRVALVCIAKNEDNYIEEWIDYHRKLKFDKFFIYQNNWRFSKDFDDVVKCKLNGETKQLTAYNHFIRNNYWDFDWVAFFDVDEFLVLKKHNNIKEFLEEYSECDAIGINWVIFGDNNLQSITEWSVINRFTKRQLSVNSHIKSIVRLCKDGEKPIFNNPHNVDLNWVDTHKRVNNGPMSKIPSDDIAQLNHYFVKTKQEFMRKIQRGRADIHIKRNVDEFDIMNFNEIEDLNAYVFYNRC